MNIKLLYIIATITFLNSCNNSVEPNFSSIPDPYLRWRAYNISNYSIEQHHICFCSNRGLFAKITVQNNTITNVINRDTGVPLPPEEWQRYKTIDGLFEIIHSINRDSVAAFMVEYDGKYGYPKSFYVDPNAQIADEEYGYDSNNLMREN